MNRQTDAFSHEKAAIGTGGVGTAVRCGVAQRVQMQRGASACRAGLPLFEALPRGLPLAPRPADQPPSWSSA
jgi:hypothetical protein